MRNENFRKPDGFEWRACLHGNPQECKQIMRLAQNQLSRIERHTYHRRRKLDNIKQGVDAIRSHCYAVSELNREVFGRQKTQEDLPCQKLRRQIVEEKLGGRL